MDWINHNADFTDHDFTVFEYESAQPNDAVIISKTSIDDVGQAVSKRCRTFWFNRIIQYPIQELLAENNTNYDEIETEKKLDEKVWTKGEDVNTLSPSISFVTSAHAKQPA